MDISITSDRLNEAFLHLKNKGQISTQKEIADVMGSYPSNISKAFKGDPKYLTPNFLVRFNHAFGDIFNPSWLAGEDSTMLRPDMDVREMPCYYNETSRSIHANGSDRPSYEDAWYKICDASFVKWDKFRTMINSLIHDPNIDASNQFVKELWLDYNFNYNKGDDAQWQPPEKIIRNFRSRSNSNSTIEVFSSSDDPDYVSLLPLEAMAGTLQGFSEGVELSSCRKIKSPVKGADWAIQISGDSMEPDYRNGSYLFIKKMTGKLIPWGHTLVVDTLDGVVVKNIYPCENDDEYIEAQSINPKYPPFKIEKSIVIGLYRVLGGTFINSTI